MDGELYSAPTALKIDAYPRKGLESQKYTNLLSLDKKD